jgi:hypothetical protein
VCIVVLCLVSVVFFGASVATSQPQRNPFVGLWGAIANLQQQIDGIEAIPGPPGPPRKALTEISLVSAPPGLQWAGSGEATRFLWEPHRYDPAPVEIYLEIVASVREDEPPSDFATFFLQDLTSGLPIAGSELTVSLASQGRLRTENIAFAMPTGTTEIALVKESSATFGFGTGIHRSAVLVQ